MKVEGEVKLTQRLEENLVVRKKGVLPPLPLTSF